MPKMARTTSQTRLVDSAGRLINIAAKPFAVGGEGSVFDVVDRSDYVAKVYHKALSEEHSEKLCAMAGAVNPELLSISAWPLTTLYDRVGGTVNGILLPRIDRSKEIHHLYSVAQRKKDFPEADWRFLAFAARNCAIAFQTVHQHGHVIGDVNQKNVLVSEKGTVKFVDCDSFQIRAANGSVYRCSVGVPEYTPPELQGKSFREIDRSTNHDSFGLAVLIFHLLMMGRHPYSGRYMDRGDMPLEKAIQGRRYAYSRDSHSTRMLPPPNTLPIAVLGEPLLGLFERAFMGTGNGARILRPTPDEWRQSLDAFIAQLGRCRFDPKHVYSKGKGSCPWCRMFLGGASVMFFLPGRPAKDGTNAGFDLVAIWSRIESISPPVSSYSRPRAADQSPRASALPKNILPPRTRLRLHPRPTPPSKADTFFEKLTLVWLVLCIALSPLAPPVGITCAIVFMFWYILLVSTRSNRKARLVEAAHEEWSRLTILNDQLRSEWEQQNSGWVEEKRKRTDERDRLAAQLSAAEELLKESSQKAKSLFESIRDQLAFAKESYEQTRAQYSKALQELSNKSSQLQLERHLDTFLIRNARLPRISSTQILSLSSFGIETAWDVKKLIHLAIPGIGPATCNKLCAWRTTLEASFKPQPGIPSVERASLANQYDPRLERMESQLSAGHTRLRRVISAAEGDRKDHMAGIQSLVDRLAQAQSDVLFMERIEAALAG